MDTLAIGTLVATPLGVGIVTEESHWSTSERNYVQMYHVALGLTIRRTVQFTHNEVAPLTHGPEEAPKRTAIPCIAYSPIVGEWSAELIYHHDTGNVTLESDLRIDYVELERSERVFVVLRAENGLRWAIRTEAWEAIQKAAIAEKAR